MTLKRANIRGPLAAAVTVLLVVNCGSSPTTAPGPSIATLAVQADDLPSGMQKCDVSGDINNFLNKINTHDPNAYSTTQNEWQATKKIGATAAEVAFFTDSADGCTTLESGADLRTATYKVVVNFVFQFKDEAMAAAAYTSESIMGFAQSQLKNAGATFTDGTLTGLGANSVWFSLISTSTFYIAVWQNKAFVVYLLLLSLDNAASHSAAVAENGRIH